jgi:hypothetical protein
VPRTVALDPLVSTQHVGFGKTARNGGRGSNRGEHVAGFRATGLGTELHRAHTPMTALGGVVVHDDASDDGLDVFDDVAALPAAGDRKRRRRERVVDRGGEPRRFDRRAVVFGDGDAPFDGRDRVHQRGCSFDEHGGVDDVDADRQRVGDGCRQPVEVDLGGELDVEVLGVALVTGRQGQAETHLRAGREPLREGERERRDAERALEGAGNVTVRDPADLAALRVVQPHRELGAALHETATPGRVGRSRTGASPPVPRSCPVPWLPPAGATGDATTCSSA